MGYSDGAYDGRSVLLRRSRCDPLYRDLFDYFVCRCLKGCFVRNGCDQSFGLCMKVSLNDLDLSQSSCEFSNVDPTHRLVDEILFLFKEC